MNIGHIFQLSEAVGHFYDNFDAELHAILMAPRAIKNIDVRNVVLFVDSRVAIHTVTDYHLDLTSTEYECKLPIRSLIESGRDVVLQWIPSNCDVPGNERADVLAKQGCSFDQPDSKFPLRNKDY